MVMIQNLPLFLSSCLMLSISPGPASAYILGRSLAQGRRAGALSVLGIDAGLACHMVAVAFGLAALVAKTPMAFSVLKYLGFMYLVYLGIVTLRARDEYAMTPEQGGDRQSGRSIFLQGMLTNLLNPKASMFALSLLPQFVSSGAKSNPTPYLVLGAMCIAIDIAWFMTVVFASSAMSAWLLRSQRAQMVMRNANGVLYICLGFNLLRATAG